MMLAMTTMLGAFPRPSWAEDQAYPVSPTIQLDGARKISLGDMCPPPNSKSIRRSSGTYTMTLHGGDVGRCPGDELNRYGAAFRERVMINGVNFPKRGQHYRFSAMVRFDANTTSANDTTFFEVHQWLTPECSCFPVLMLYVMADGHLEAESSSYSEVAYLRRNVPGWTRADFEDRWIEVAADVSTVSGIQTVRLYLGGQLVYDQPSLIYDAGAIRPHWGFYRPGDPARVNPTDRIFVRDLRVAEFN